MGRDASRRERPVAGFKSEAQLRVIGACEAGSEFNDEGPIIAVPTDTKPLKAIYEWIKQDVASLEAENGVDFFSSSRLLGIMKKSRT